MWYTIDFSSRFGLHCRGHTHTHTLSNPGGEPRQLQKPQTSPVLIKISKFPGNTAKEKKSLPS